jgi:hypothetical protein
MQTSLGDRLSHRLAKLGDDDLFGFGNRVERRSNCHQPQHGEGSQDDLRAATHGFTSWT